MTLSAREYAGRVRDSKWERDLAQKLRRLPEHECLGFIQDFAVANPAVALDLAKKCLSKRQSFEALLDQALNDANSSGIRYWLEAIVPRLGIRRVVALLRDRAYSKADAVSQAAYWLPMFASQQGFCQADIVSLRSFVRARSSLDG
jgi:hypothetical protein